VIYGELESLCMRVDMSERNSEYLLQLPDQNSVFAGVQCEVQLVESGGGLVQPESP
jgi:hypothetical protein